MKNIELYLIIILIIVIIGLIVSTIRFYRGEKRKVKNLHRFAKEGEIVAQNRLAKCYQEGDMVMKNCQKAAFWYQRAAFAGDDNAKGHLKNFFDNKNMIEKKKC